MFDLYVNSVEWYMLSEIRNRIRLNVIQHRLLIEKFIAIYEFISILNNIRKAYGSIHETDTEEEGGGRTSKKKKRIVHKHSNPQSERVK